MFNQQEIRQARLNAFDGLALNERTYNLVIGAVVLWGLGLNWFMAAGPLAGAIMTLSPLAIIIIYLIGSLGGIFIVYRSDVPAVSFLGFTVLALAMGLLLTYYLAFFTQGTIVAAVRITAITTAVMLILAVLFPQFFLSLGRTLFIALGACLVVSLVCGLLLRMDMAWLDYVVALIFCGYIGYDWSRAQMFPKTLDNAIDSAADIYVDIINLFIRVLSILGRNQNRSGD